MTGTGAAVQEGARPGADADGATVPPARADLRWHLFAGVWMASLAAVLFDFSRAFLLQRSELERSAQLIGACAAVLAIHAVFGAVVGAVAALPGAALLSRAPAKAASRIARTVYALGMASLVVFLCSSVGLLASASGGFDREMAPRPPATDAGGRPNILLVVVDSLRQDALEQALARTLVPSVAALRREASVYTEHHSVSSWTFPSMAGLVTGQYPSLIHAHHGAISPDLDTLAERLHEAGYETVGISDNRLVTASTGFAQGHDLFWHRQDNSVFLALLSVRWLPAAVRNRLQWTFGLYFRGAGRVNRQVADFLARRDASRPSFLMIHYMDVHAPFPVHSDIPDNVSNGSTPETLVRHYEVFGRPEMAERPPFAILSLPQPQIDDFWCRYVGGIQYLDAHLGQLFGWLKSADAWDDTLVILTSDHGDEFFEHRFFGHGAALYQESIRVPLIVKLPGGGPGRATTITRPVSALQVRSTILREAGLPLESHALPPLPAADSGPPETVYADFKSKGMRIGMARSGQLKMLFSRRFDGKELYEIYDLGTDPEEKQNLFGTDATGAAALDARLGEFLARVSQARARHPDTPMTDEEKDRLRSLGYLD